MLFQPKNLGAFNCFSYAMGITDKWIDIEPCTIKKCSEYLKCYSDCCGDINVLANKFIKEQVLNRFPNLVIVSEKDIKKHTRLIAFKLGNSDFHFMRRFPNGHWFQKQGGDIIQPIKKSEVFKQTWNFRYYISDTIFLGYKEDY